MHYEICEIGPFDRDVIMFSCFEMRQLGYLFYMALGYCFLFFNICAMVVYTALV